MLTVRAPSPDQIDGFVRKHGGNGFNTPSGLTEGTAPPRWFVDDVDAILGIGNDAFEAAAAALRHWEQMNLPWFKVHRPDRTPLDPGVVVAYSARIAGMWMTFACRIVSVIDEVDPDGGRRFGFVYGTIDPHAAKGEERFLVRLDARTREVHGSIRAVSRPARWYMWAGLPVARRAQRLFKAEALAILAGAVRRRMTPAGQDLRTRPR